MIDREKVVNVLKKRFPGAPEHQVAAAANAIVGLEDEWEEVKGAGDVPLMTEAAKQEVELKVFRRRGSFSAQ